MAATKPICAVRIREALAETSARASFVPRPFRPDSKRSVSVLPAVETAIIVVAVPAEETDIHKACTNGQPSGTEVDQTEFVKHVPPSLIKAGSFLPY